MFGKATRVGVRFGLAALAALIAGNALKSAVAAGNTRSLTMHHVHTDETITITYMRDGRYDQAALKKLDWFLRDWRRNEAVHMDPHLFDVLWQAYRETGATKPIEIICGYRAPKTNALLRARSGGVAKFSQHILGKAMDFFIPGVPLAKLRAVGLKLQRGGVGFYPKSGSPFVHMDVASVRHWPGISREELVKIFPDGRTVHIPRDGKPLPGYAQALAELEQRGKVPNARSLQLARAAGVITNRDERVAERVAQNRKQTLVALVTSGRDNGLAKDEIADDESADNEVGAPLQLASLRSSKPVPLPQGRPQGVTTAATQAKPQTPVVTASASTAFNRRFWPAPIERQAATPSPFKIAGADMTATGSTGDEALAYAAAEPSPAPTAHKPAKPMGQRLRAHLPRLVTPAWAETGPLAMEAKSLLGTPMAIGAQRLSSPWTRAAMLTPSVSRTMTVSRLVSSDPRLLQDLLYKPAQAVKMGFAADPQAGMTADRFSGQAVVFLATTRFLPQQTASLR